MKKRIKLEYSANGWNDYSGYWVNIEFFPDLHADFVNFLCWHEETKEKEYRSLDFENIQI
jgi:hypothetical protein